MAYDWDRAASASIDDSAPTDEEVGAMFDRMPPDERRKAFIAAMKASIGMVRRCEALGAGDMETGADVMDEICAHVRHADQAHPWPERYPLRLGLQVVRDELREADEQFHLAEGYGFGKDDTLRDEAKVAESLEHLAYEIADAIAPAVKLMRALL